MRFPRSSSPATWTSLPQPRPMYAVPWSVKRNRALNLPLFSLDLLQAHSCRHYLIQAQLNRAQWRSYAFFFEGNIVFIDPFIDWVSCTFLYRRRTIVGQFGNDSGNRCRSFRGRCTWRQGKRKERGYRIFSGGKIRRRWHIQADKSASESLSPGSYKRKFFRIHP